MFHKRLASKMTDRLKKLNLRYTLKQLNLRISQSIVGIGSLMLFLGVLVKEGEGFYLTWWMALLFGWAGLVISIAYIRATEKRD